MQDSVSTRGGAGPGLGSRGAKGIHCSADVRQEEGRKSVCVCVSASVLYVAPSVVTDGLLGCG